jgi:hypothetical protein
MESIALLERTDSPEMRVKALDITSLSVEQREAPLGVPLRVEAGQPGHSIGLSYHAVRGASSARRPSAFIISLSSGPSN